MDFETVTVHVNLAKDTRDQYTNSHAMWPIAVVKTWDRTMSLKLGVYLYNWMQRTQLEHSEWNQYARERSLREPASVHNFIVSHETIDGEPCLRKLSLAMLDEDNGIRLGQRQKLYLLNVFPSTGCNLIY